MPFKCLGKTWKAPIQCSSDRSLLQSLRKLRRYSAAPVHFVGPSVVTVSVCLPYHRHPRQSTVELSAPACQSPAIATFSCRAAIGPSGNVRAATCCFGAKASRVDSASLADTIEGIFQHLAFEYVSDTSHRALASYRSMSSGIVICLLSRQPIAAVTHSLSFSPSLSL